MGARAVFDQGDRVSDRTGVADANETAVGTRLDAAIFYAVNDAVDLQLNVENLTGEEYWYTAHNDNNITPGAPLGVRLGLTWRH